MEGKSVVEMRARAAGFGNRHVQMQGFDPVRTPAPPLISSTNLVRNLNCTYERINQGSMGQARKADARHRQVAEKFRNLDCQGPQGAKV